MDWIDHKANIAKFIPSQWGHIKDYTDMTNRDTEAERPKLECFTIDNYFTLMLCHRCGWGHQQEKPKMRVKTESGSFNISDSCIDLTHCYWETISIGAWLARKKPIDGITTDSMSLLNQHLD